MHKKTGAEQRFRTHRKRCTENTVLFSMLSKRESGQMPERSRHCKEEQSCMDEHPVTGEPSLGRRSRARIPSQENCLFYAPCRSTRDGKGSRLRYRDDTAAFFVEKAFFIMKVQEIKPKGTQADWRTFMKGGAQSPQIRRLCV